MASSPLLHLEIIQERLTCEFDLEVVFDFYDRLKSISRGYASFDYHQIGHREGDLVKMSILVNGDAPSTACQGRRSGQGPTR